MDAGSPAGVRGVVAVAAPAAPKARHGCDENTGTLAPASPPAPSNSPAARGTAIPGAIAGNFPVMTAPRVTSAGKNIPLTKAGRHDRPAPRRPDHQPGEGREGGAVYRGDGVVALATARLIFACRPHQPATGTGRAGQIGGPAGRSPSGDGIGSGLG